MRRNQSQAKSMLPSHLVRIARVISLQNDADEAHVALRVTCVCGGEQFVVRFAGRVGDGFITAERCGEDLEFAIAAECPRCRDTHWLFDRRRHGWGPVLFPAGSQPTQSPVKSIWHCGSCGSTQHEFEIVIGWSTWAEVTEELNNRPDFNESVWIEAFETIQIHLRCVSCGQETKHWVEFAVV